MRSAEKTVKTPPREGQGKDRTVEISNTPMVTLDFLFPAAACPNAILGHVNLNINVEAPSADAARKGVEDQLKTSLEAQVKAANPQAACGFECDEPATECKFDYVLGDDVQVIQVRAPGKKTQLHNKTVANGLYRYTGTASWGCFCVARSF